jgi:hypothetical protein
MTDLARQEVFPFLVRLAPGMSNGANDASGPSLSHQVLEMSEPESLGSTNVAHSRRSRNSVVQRFVSAGSNAVCKVLERISPETTL